MHGTRLGGRGTDLGQRFDRWRFGVPGGMKAGPWNQGFAPPVGPASGALVRIATLSRDSSSHSAVAGSWAPDGVAFAHRPLPGVWPNVPPPLCGADPSRAPLVGFARSVEPWPCRVCGDATPRQARSTPATAAQGTRSLPRRIVTLRAGAIRRRLGWAAAPRSPPAPDPPRAPAVQPATPERPQQLSQAKESRLEAARRAHPHRPRATPTFTPRPNRATIPRLGRNPPCTPAP
jgi:hypothetical protein